MENKFEAKIRKFLPFIVIIALVFLIAPAFLSMSKTDKYNSLVYLGAFPLTTFLCAFIYSYKNGNDFFFSLIAPIIYLPSMFLYGNYKDSILNCIIFLASYFLCGYIGLLIGDLGYTGKKGNKQTNRTEKDAKTGKPSDDLDLKEVYDNNLNAVDDSDDFFKKYDSKQSDGFSENDNLVLDDEVEKIIKEVHDEV